jgi:ribose transport system permease protein
VIQIPIVLLIAIGITILAAVYLKYSVYGRCLFAVGGNSEASWFSGINPKRHRLLTYVVSSVLAAFSGFLLCARLGMGHPDIGAGNELDAIAAVVLGGASLSGGRGSVLGTVVGVITLGLIGNILNLLNIPSYPQDAIRGAIIIVAVLGQLGHADNSKHD